MFVELQASEDAGFMVGYYAQIQPRVDECCFSIACCAVCYFANTFNWYYIRSVHETLAAQVCVDEHDRLEFNQAVHNSQIEGILQP